MYLLRCRSGPDDLAEAATCFTLSADQGFMHAQNAYGECLYAGIGVPIDFVAAAVDSWDFSLHWNRMLH
jgi:TPR repeat protein